MALEPKTSPSLALATWCQVTGAWTTYDPEVLTALDPLHIWTQDFIETRLKWRAKQPITVLELRAWQLAQPFQLQVGGGCASWVLHVLMMSICDVDQSSGGQARAVRTGCCMCMTSICCV